MIPPTLRVPSRIRNTLLFSYALCSVVCSGIAFPAPPNNATSTIVVAASDSSAQSKASAQFVADGQADQEEINAAVRALPAAGGTVTLMEGTYNIHRVEGTLGGVLIDRGHVTLSGQGTATRLSLAANQNTNVIRIIGSDVGHITIRDLFVDANREQNAAGTGDPNISHDRFEFCGIKAFRQAPRGPTAEVDTHDITVQNCVVKNAHRLGIMLEGPNMRVVDNVLGNAGSDSVEILTGPGIIHGNLVQIDGQTHVAIGSDRADSIVMSENIVRVKQGGALDIGFRSWANSKRHVISQNVLTVDDGGKCTLAMDVRGTEATVTANNLHSSSSTDRPRLRLGAGNVIVTANVLENVDIEVDDETAAGKPIRVHDNLLENSSVLHRRGNLVGHSEQRNEGRADARRLPRPFRGAYLHPANMFDPRQDVATLERIIRDELDRMKAFGINAILPFINGSSGAAFYPSEIRTEHVYGKTDPIAMLISEARKRGIASYPVMCVAVSGHQEPAGILKAHPEWAMRHADGRPAGFISPAHPAAREWLATAAREVVTKYQPDGLVLDYIRYENRPLRLDPAAETRFQNSLPANRSADEERALLQKFRERELTELVRQISEAARNAKQDLVMAAYCWGAHVANDHQIAQVWPEWIELGYLDMINISGYCHRETYGDKYLEVFERRLSDAIALNKHCRQPAVLTFALGVKTSHGNVQSAADVRDYERIAERLKLDGEVYFTWEYLKPFLEDLRQSSPAN